MKHSIIILFLLVISNKLFSQCFPLNGSPPSPSVFNTGTNGNGGRLAISSNDLNWKVATNSINGTYKPAIIIAPVVGYYYSSPWNDCTWISHNSTAGHSGNVDYFYKMEFNLPCNNLCRQSFDKEGTFCLNLDFFADNSVYEIYVNNKSQSANIGKIPLVNPYIQTGYSSTGMISVSLCKDWKSGNNSITVHIKSGEDRAGFLAQASVIPSVPTPNIVNLSICQGETLKFGNQNLTQAGVYTETFKPYNGCDSLVSLNLSVLQKTLSNYDTIICQSQLPFWGHNTAGTYLDKLVAKNGCDSLRTLKLTVLESPKISFSNKTVICTGQSQIIEIAPTITSSIQPIAYKWSTGETTSKIVIKQAGAFELIVGNGFCNAKASTIITEGIIPKLKPDETICLNSPAIILESGANITGLNYIWTPTNSISPTLSVSQIGKYQVKVITPVGCEATRTINVLDAPKVDLGNDKELCKGEIFEIIPSIIGGGAYNFSWSSGEFSKTIKPSKSGKYKLTISSGSCNVSDSINVLFNELPDIATNVNACKDDPINAGKNDNSFSYLWEHSGETTYEVNVQNEGIYKIKVTNQFGCFVNRIINVLGPCEPKIYAPNSFTPNENGINDFFQFYSLGTILLELRIFNRWGELIYNEISNSPKWDGKRMEHPAADGIYNYLLYYKTLLIDKPQIKKGNVLLLR